jgi:hypothetical protein
VFAESSPFVRTFVVHIPVTCVFPDLGLILAEDHMSRRNIIVEVHEFSSSAKIDWEHNLRHRTIVQIEDTPVFLTKDVHRRLAHVDTTTHDSIQLIVADYKPEPRSDPVPVPQIALDQMQAIHHVLHGWDLSDPVLIVAPAPHPVTIVTAENASTMAKCQRHTRRTCLKGPHREKWIDAEFAQLDKHNSYGMYGPPIARSAVPSSGTVVRPIWNYSH